MANLYKNIGSSAAAVMSILAVAGGVLWYDRTGTADQPRPQDEAELMTAILERNYAMGRTNSQFTQNIPASVIHTYVTNSTHTATNPLSVYTTNAAAYTLTNTVDVVPRGTFKFKFNSPGGIVQQAFENNGDVNWIFPNESFLYSGTWDGRSPTGMAINGGAYYWAPEYNQFINTNKANSGQAAQYFLMSFDSLGKYLVWDKKCYSDIGRAMACLQWQQKIQTDLPRIYISLLLVKSYTNWPTGPFTESWTVSTNFYNNSRPGHGAVQSGGIYYNGGGANPFIADMQAYIECSPSITNTTPFTFSSGYFNINCQSLATNGGCYIPSWVSSITTGTTWWTPGSFNLSPGQGIAPQLIDPINGTAYSDISPQNQTNIANTVYSEMKAAIYAFLADQQSRFPTTNEIYYIPHYGNSSDSSDGLNLIPYYFIGDSSFSFLPGTYTYFPCTTYRVNFNACTDYTKFGPAR